MATSTVSFISDQVRNLTKLNTTALDSTLLLSSISMAIYDIAHSNNWPELNKSVVNPAAALITLPPDFMQLDRVRYFTISPPMMWRLNPREGLLTPALIVGKPKAYYISGFPNNSASCYALGLDPVSQIDPSDTCSISYYRLPTSPFSATNLDSPNWDTEIIAKASQYVMNYLNKPEQAKELASIHGVGQQQQQQPQPQS